MGIMTCRQLMKWLALGNGLVQYLDDQGCVHISTSYDLRLANKDFVKVMETQPVSNVFVKPWDHNDWILPTEDLLYSNPEDLI